MRCFHRSTRSFADAFAGAAIAAVVAAGTIGVSADAVVDDRTELVRRAIVAAVQERMAPTSVTVTVEAITDLRFDADVRSVTAHVAPYARVGEPARFVLTAPGRRGEATALVQVQAESVRARTAIQRGATIIDSDVHVDRVDLARLPIRPLPQAAEVIGGKALREIAVGALLARGDVAPVPAVRVGREVTAHVTIGEVRVTATLVAAQNGMPQQIIRVMNPETREVRRARVVAVDEVEVLHAR